MGPGRRSDVSKSRRKLEIHRCLLLCILASSSWLLDIWWQFFSLCTTENRHFLRLLYALRTLQKIITFCFENHHVPFYTILKFNFWPKIQFWHNFTFEKFCINIWIFAFVIQNLMQNWLNFWTQITVWNSVHMPSFLAQWILETQLKCCKFMITRLERKTTS